MILSTLSALLCLALTVKLLFFTDQHRQESRWYYRVLLFVVAAYAGKQVIDYIYHPESVGLLTVWFHAMLLIGSLVIQPYHLPWNQINEPRNPQTLAQAWRALAGLWRRIRSSLLHGREGQARS